MRDDGEWMVTLPDVFGRPVLQGVVLELDISRDMFAGNLHLLNLMHLQLIIIATVRNADLTLTLFLY